jgi:MFS family permease
VIFNIGLLGLLDVVLNFYFVSLGNNSETIGLLQSLPRLAGFLTSVPIGLLTNRIGTRRVIIISSIGCALALWVQLIPALPMLALSRFLYGLAYGAQQIANAPLMVELTDPKERTQFSRCITS